MNDTIECAKTEGEIFFHNQNLLARETEITELRTRIGMIFQKPNPFPMAIYNNVAYGPRIHRH